MGREPGLHLELRAIGTTDEAPRPDLPRHACVAVVADTHLGPSEEGLRAFERFLRGLPPRVEALVHLGDLFEVWIGRRPLLEPWQGRVLSLLDDVAREGREVHLVEGNRDYLVKSLSPSPFARVGSSLGFEIGGRRVLCEHGDLINREDRAYRLWRSLSRSTPARLLTGVLPPRLVRRLMKRTERGMRETNLPHKHSLPRPEIEAHLRRRAEEGWEQVLVGHFHAHHRFEEGDAVLEILPAWVDSRRWLLLDAEGARLRDPC